MLPVWRAVSRRTLFSFTSHRCTAIPFVENQSHGAHRSLSFPSPYYKREFVRSRNTTNLLSSFNMEKLPELADVTRLSDHVVRVLGQNPGKFTLQGTNTYIIGTQNPYILIDTAEGLASYIPVLTSALQSISDPSQPDVSDIIISHWHHDHVGGLPTVLALLKELWEARNPGKSYTPPRLHKYPVSENVAGGHQSHYNQLPKLLEQLPRELYAPPDSSAGGVFHDLHDAQVIKDESGSTILRVLHTPGHTVDSICLFIPQDRALYTADTVLGHGTAVFEDLATYLASLNRMLHFGSTSPSPAESQDSIDLEYVNLYPAHGAVIPNGRETISTYIKHRLERETQIVGVLQSPLSAEFVAPTEEGLAESSGLWSTWNIVRNLYKAYPENLWLPAARGVDLHLKKLEGDGLVKRAGGEGTETQWKLLISAPNTPNL